MPALATVYLVATLLGAFCAVALLTVGWVTNRENMLIGGVFLLVVLPLLVVHTAYSI